jgi:Ca2+-binding EF-hand superfamily protein
MKRFLALGLAVALLAGAAGAQTLLHPKPAPPPRIFLSPSGEPFRFSPATPDPLKAWFDQADANHDGTIDRFEFRADAARFFKRLDENGDGVIDGFEAADYEHKVAPELDEQEEGRLPGQFGGSGDQEDSGGHHSGQNATEPHRESHEGPPRGGPGQKPERRIGQLIDEPEPVTGADFNLYGHITMDEWVRAADQRFDLLDTAKTGRLTLDQLRAKLNAPVRRGR